MEPSVATVIITGLVLVFAILVLLFLVIALQGAIFKGIDEKKKAAAAKPAPAPAAKAAPAVKAAPAAPAVQAGIPGEVVAAISAAVAAACDGPVAVKSIQRANAAAAPAARRNGWGLAAVYSYTDPF